MLGRGRPWHYEAWKFVRTPKGLMLVILVAVALAALPQAGASRAAPEVLVAVAVAAALDVVIVRVFTNRIEFPAGAILTGLIIALILRPQEPLGVVAFTSAVAIAARHVLRTRWSNVFNPAALGIVVASFVFSPGQSWWGALPDLGVVGIAVLLGAGLFMADRLNKLPMMLVFLSTYFFLFTASSFVGEPNDVAEIFRSPDLQAALFFAFFMLDDPPTCPVRYEDQVIFAAVVAIAAFLVFTLNGAVYFLPAGLLVGNAWESARRQFRDWVPRSAEQGQPA